MCEELSCGDLTRLVLVDVVVWLRGGAGHIVLIFELY